MNPHAADSLSQALKAATTDLHRLAERSAFMRALLTGTLSTPDFLDWFASLHCIYQPLERELPRHAALTELTKLVDGGLARSAALEADIRACERVYVSDKPQAEPFVPCQPARDYAAHLNLLSEEQPLLLAAHVYVRYLGDLHGGRLIGQALGRAPALPQGAGAFSEYSQAVDVADNIIALKHALDALGHRHPEMIAQCAAEGASAFARHIELFAALEERRQARLARISTH